MLVLLPLDQPPLFKLSKLVSPKEVRSSEVRLLLLCLVSFSEELDCITVKMLLSNFLPLRDTSKSLFSNFETIFHLETNFSPPRDILPHRDMSPTGKCLQLATTFLSPFLIEDPLSFENLWHRFVHHRASISIMRDRLQHGHVASI